MRANLKIRPYGIILHMADKRIREDTRRNSLRLREFDYSAPRAYFVTICAKEGPAVLSDRKVATSVIDSLKEEKLKRGYKIYAWCLMPDHLHILLNPADSGVAISQFVQAFKSRTGFWYEKQYGKLLWQRSFYDHIVRMSEDAIKIADYILNNPVRKGMAEKPEDYPYLGTWDEIEQ
jgi:putative transposase